MNFNSVFEELNKLYEDKESLTEATIYTTKAKMAQLDKAVEDAQKEVAKYKIPMKRNSAGESEPDFEAVPENQREAAKAAHDKYQKALAARPSRSQNIIKYTDEMDESLTEMLPREPVVYDHNGRRIMPKDPTVLAVWAKVVDQAEAEGVTFWDDYETQKGLIDRSLTPDEKKLLKNVEFEDGSIRAAYFESLNEAADDEEIEFAEEPVDVLPEDDDEAEASTDEEVPEEDVSTVEEFLKSVGEYDGDLKLEFKPVVIDGKEYSVTGLLWDDTEEGKLVAEVIIENANDNNAEEGVVEEEPVDESLENNLNESLDLNSTDTELNEIAMQLAKKLFPNDITKSSTFSVKTFSSKDALGSGGHIVIFVNPTSTATNYQKVATETYLKKAVAVVKQLGYNPGVTTVKELDGKYYAVLDNFVKPATQALQAEQPKQTAKPKAVALAM